MSRQARIELPGIPLHVTQRGVNRCAIFLDDHDRKQYLDMLRSACRKHEVTVHAYVLMGNHVHLLLCAPLPGLVSRAMRLIGQNHALAFNGRHQRCGTLWQERFKSCLVDNETHVLNVIRYIELNPVRAAMVATPEAYCWSSARAHLGMPHQRIISPHHAYMSLGGTVAERAGAYASWLQRPIDCDESDTIRRYLAQQKALGEPRFQELVARALNRPVILRAPGRQRRVART